MAADYTFDEAVVLVEGTGELAIGATGVLLPPLGGDPVQVYDMNGSPIPNVVVGPFGVHQQFRADIPQGLLDFGSKVLVKESQQQRDAGMAALLAVEALEPRIDALEAGTTAGFSRVLSLSRTPTAQDANNGDLVLVNPNFNG